MALKRKITKEAYDKLSDELKKEYSELDGGYQLSIDGDEDPAELRRAKERETQEKKDALKKVKELEEQLSSITGDDARKRGDIETLEKSWKDKLEKQTAESDAKHSAVTNHLKTLLVDNVAKEIAHKISTSPAVILPHIRQRLSADFDGETPITRVLDAAGKPSALSVDELAKEFVDNKEFSSIIIASKASGGAGTSKGGAFQPPQQDGKPVDFSKMSPRDMAAHLTAKKEQSAGQQSGKF